MSSSLLQKIAPMTGTLVSVLDTDRIINDLIKLRDAAGLSQRKLAAMIGVSYTTIQDIETRKRSLWIDDFAKWLEACGSSLPLYVSQHLAADEVEVLKQDKDLTALFLEVLRIPAKREALKPALMALLAHAGGRRGKSRE